MNINAFCYTGKVRDVQSRTTANGSRFSVVVMDHEKRENGQAKALPLEFSFFGEAGEAVRQSVRPGDIAMVQGRLDVREYGGKTYTDIRYTACMTIERKQEGPCIQGQPNVVPAPNTQYTQPSAQYAPAAPSAYRQQALPGMPAAPAPVTFGQYPKFTPGQTVPQTQAAPAAPAKAEDPNDVPF